MSASTTSVASRPPDAGADPRRGVVALSRLEGLRLVRHPVFVLGLVAYVASFPLLLWLSYPDADYTGDPTNAGTYDWSFLGALFVGLFGFVAANRVARNTSRTEGVVEAAPMSPFHRSLALCLACLVPFAVMTLGNLTILVLWLVDPPVLAEGWTAVATSEKVWVLVTAALAGLGGPLLGVALARWWRWPSALAVAAAGLVAWCASSVVPDSTLALRFWHVSAPFTTPDYDTEDAGVIWQGGSLSWRFAYVCGLIALAAIAAVAHGTVGSRRRRLQWLAAAVGTATLAAYLLAVFTGPATRVIAP